MASPQVTKATRSEETAFARWSQRCEHCGLACPESKPLCSETREDMTRELSAAIRISKAWWSSFHEVAAATIRELCDIRGTV